MDPSEAVEYPFSAVGTFLTRLLQALAWEAPTLRPVAHYFQSVGLAGTAGGSIRAWPMSVYSDDVREALDDAPERRENDVQDDWHEWSNPL